MKDLLVALREAHDDLEASLVLLTEADTPIGAVRTRRGALWQKISAIKWKLLHANTQPGVEAGKHPATQPVKPRWKHRQGLQ